MAKKNKGGSPMAVGYDDAEWRAEEDARTLLRAEEIRADRKRLSAAKKWASKRADELSNITSIND